MATKLMFHIVAVQNPNRSQRSSRRQRHLQLTRLALDRLLGLETGVSRMQRRVRASAVSTDSRVGENSAWSIDSFDVRARRNSSFACRRVLIDATTHVDSRFDATEFYRCTVS